jgi:hypothetical protein
MSANNVLKCWERYWVSNNKKGWMASITLTGKKADKSDETWLGLSA